MLFVFYGLKRWTYRGNKDEIKFKVSRRILMTGIRLFGSGEPYKFDVKLEV